MLLKYSLFSYSAGTNVLHLMAIDRDSGDMGMITYSLVINDSYPLMIDAHSGMLMVTRSLIGYTEMNFTVQATDGGGLKGDAHVRYIFLTIL